MMDERELIEKAAKAYGLDPEYKYEDSPYYTGMCRRNFDECGFEIQDQIWNPLTDERDLYRMARKLGITISFRLQSAHREAMVVSWPEDAKNDVYAAVTLAAMLADRIK